MFGKQLKVAGDTVIGERGYREMVLSAADALRHTMVFGTGSIEKREVMLDFLAAAALDGGGALLIDSSGDAGMRSRVWKICCDHGRLKDLRFLDFRTVPESSYKGNGHDFLIDPFESLETDKVVSMIVDMLPDAGGDGAMWKGRATAMLTGVMRCLCWLRDQGDVEVDAAKIRDSIKLLAIIDFANPVKYPEMPGSIRKSIQSYLSSVPGYQEDRLSRQSQTTMDQHGYLEMQFTSILDSLASYYGNTFSSQDGTLKLGDVVSEKLLTVVLLPVHDAVYSGAAGKAVLGAFRSVVLRLADEGNDSQGKLSFRLILGDLPYYLVFGMALFLQAARTVGIGVVASAESPAQLSRSSQRESLAMGDNTWNRIYLRMGSPEAVEHIRQLPIPIRDRNRIIGLPVDRAAYLNGGNLRYIRLPEPVQGPVE